jgi:ankyrin repeat protein
MNIPIIFLVCMIATPIYAMDKSKSSSSENYLLSSSSSGSINTISHDSYSDYSPKKSYSKISSSRSFKKKDKKKKSISRETAERISVIDSLDDMLLLSQVLTLDNYTHVNLIIAIQNRNTPKALQLLKQNIDVNQMDSAGNSPLIVAIQNRNADVIAELLKHEKIDFNQADKLGKTPLILAIQMCYYDLISYLINNEKVDVNKDDICNNTPLHYAVCQNDHNIIQTLLESHRINTLLRNKKKLFAHQYIDADNHHLKTLFFIRARLDRVVEEHVSILRTNIKNSVPDALNKAIDAVQKSIEHDGDKQQEHQPLPESIQLPVDEKFIKNMIIHRLAKQADAERHTLT